MKLNISNRTLLSPLTPTKESTDPFLHGNINYGFLNKTLLIGERHFDHNENDFAAFIKKYDPKCTVWIEHYKYDHSSVEPPDRQTIDRLYNLAQRKQLKHTKVVNMDPRSPGIMDLLIYLQNNQALHLQCCRIVKDCWAQTLSLCPPPDIVNKVVQNEINIAFNAAHRGDWKECKQTLHFIMDWCLNAEILSHRHEKGIVYVGAEHLHQLDSLGFLLFLDPERINQQIILNYIHDTDPSMLNHDKIREYVGEA